MDASSLLSSFFSNVRNDVNGQPPAQPQLSPEDEQRRRAKLAALQAMYAGPPPAAPQVNPQAAAAIANVFR